MATFVFFLGSAAAATWFRTSAWFPQEVELTAPRWPFLFVLAVREIGVGVKGCAGSVQACSEGFVRLGVEV